MTGPRSTGLPRLDAQHDFIRARRRAILARLATRLRLEPDDVEVILPYEEAIEALGFVSERHLGLQVASIAQIVGTVDRGRDFDRHFRPTSSRVRSRWEQIAAAMRRGESLPPVDLYKIGEIYFVRDGHHRVSVACALGHADIDAYVTEMITRVGINHPITLADLPLKSHERVLYERVPLPDEAPRTSVYRIPGTTRCWPRASRPGGSARFRSMVRRPIASRRRGCGSRPSIDQSLRCSARAV